MTKTNKRFGGIIFLLALVAVWFRFDYLKRSSISKQSSAQLVSEPESNFENSEKIEELLDLKKIPSVVSTTRTESNEPEAEPIDDSLNQFNEALNQLGELLPNWIREEGDVLQDIRDINGRSVLRSRARYHLEEGEQLEIEITDVGENADVSVMKVLGFDLELDQTETESGFTRVQDEGDYLLNQEYHYEDQAGSIQMLVHTRYLIEIQIQQLPEEIFQEIIDKDIPFDEIFRRLEN